MEVHAIGATTIVHAIQRQHFLASSHRAVATAISLTTTTGKHLPLEHYIAEYIAAVGQRGDVADALQYEGHVQRNVPGHDAYK